MEETHAGNLEFRDGTEWNAARRTGGRTDVDRSRDERARGIDVQRAVPCQPRRAATPWVVGPVQEHGVPCVPRAAREQRTGRKLGFGVMGRGREEQRRLGEWE
jgi:hypothetical protein